jgi:hypothetical protein
MTEFRFRRLDKYRVGGTRDRMELALPLPRSPRGRIQRYCPVVGCAPRRFQLADPPQARPVPEECKALFRRPPGTRGITCPYCGADNDDDAFTAPEDRKAILEHVKWAGAEDVADWFEQQLEGLGSVGRSAGLKVSLKRPRNLEPYPWREDLELTRFRGHWILWGTGGHDAEESRALPA